MNAIPCNNDYFYSTSTLVGYYSRVVTTPNTINVANPAVYAELATTFSGVNIGNALTYTYTVC